MSITHTDSSHCFHESNKKCHPSVEWTSWSWLWPAESQYKPQGNDFQSSQSNRYVAEGLCCPVSPSQHRACREAAHSSESFSGSNRHFLLFKTLSNRSKYAGVRISSPPHHLAASRGLEIPDWNDHLSKRRPEAKGLEEWIPAFQVYYIRT